MITYYNLIDERKPQSTTIDEALSWIKQSKYSESVAYFRQQLSFNRLYTDAQYKEDRKKVLPALQWNSNTESGSGFVYIDIDLPSIEDATKAKAYFTTEWKDNLYACWYSVSRKGLGLLFATTEKIENANDFKIVWQALADAIIECGYTPDPKTKDFNRVNYLSFDPDVFINSSTNVDIKEIYAEHAKTLLSESKERKETLAEKQRKEISNTLILKSQYGWRPKEYIKAKAKDARHLEVNLFTPINVGNRGNTYAAIATKLFRLNPQPEKLTEIKKLIVWLNSYKAVKPWEDSEIQNFVENIENHKKGKAISSKKVVIKNPTFKPVLDVLEVKGQVNIKSMEQTIVDIVNRADKELKINIAVKGGAKTLNDIHKKTGISKTTITGYFKSQGKQYSEQLTISDVKDVVKQLNEFIHELIKANNEALSA